MKEKSENNNLVSDQESFVSGENQIFNILVFDDSSLDYELLKYYLRNEECFKLQHVSLIDDFSEAIETKTFEVVICDFNLGGLNALDVFEIVKSKKLLIPFIVVSGALGEDKAVEILKTGVTDYVLKDKCEKLPFIIKRALRENENFLKEKKMVERLKESETKFREIFNSIIDVYFESSIDGFTKVISPSITSVLGYKPEELINTNAKNFYANKANREIYLNELLVNHFVSDYEVDLIAKDGRIRTISVNARLIFDDNGVPLKITGVYRDITEKKKQELILLQQDTQVRESHKMAKLGSWKIDFATKLVHLSEDFFQIFEYPYDENPRENFNEFAPLIHSEDRIRLESNLLRFIKSGNDYPYEFRIITPNGNLKFISLKVFKIQGGDTGSYVSGIIQDITDLKLLEEEKNNVQLQALEMLEEMVEQRTRKIEEQRTVIEKKNRDITDSINYAKQVQMAILPNKESIDAFLPQSFLLFLPKDIVAGDFYWTFSDGQKFFIAVADCTGHGVPGALVSMICFNALNRSVNEFMLRRPCDIFNKTNELVLDFFSHGSAEVKDGMDLSLLTIDFETQEIKWAGANNPLIYHDGTSLIKVQPDKMAIGTRNVGNGFTTHDIPYCSNSSYYLFTDGYADQFGGAGDKKFMLKRLMGMMELANSKSIEKQEDLFKNAFIDWKGDNDQVDDVALIGFKLP